MNKPACRCGSSQTYSECCEPFITNSLLPNTAEQLMRSRFTAFCLHEFQYLINTHHPSKLHDNELSELKNSCEQTSWVKLTIHNTQKGRTNDNTGVVEFSAIFNEDQQFFELREESSFIKENNQWFYADGKPHIQTINFKIPRNASCWCFSGKKFKHCHALL